MPVDSPPLVLVTRPEHAGRLLAARLRDAGSASGVSALWWPAFDLVPQPNDPAVQAAMAQLARFDLVVFVSPAAARSCALALRGEWPAATAIAAVGAGTAQAVLACIPDANGVGPGVDQGVGQGVGPGPRLIVPSGEAASGGGSEALLTALDRAGLQPERVLIVRAQRGRERIADELTRAGAAVEQIAVYRRTVHQPDACAWAALRASRGCGRPVVPFLSSSEGVDALREQWAAGLPPLPWSTVRAALCLHPRIADALAAQGVADAVVCDAEAGAILAAVGIAVGRTSEHKPGHKPGHAQEIQSGTLRS